MAYGLYITTAFTDFSGNGMTVNIYRRDYSGAVMERDAVSPGVALSYGDGASDGFPVLWGSKAVVSFASESPNESAALYGSDNRAFYCEIVPDGEAAIWRGWIVPEQRNERMGYKQTVAVTFMDGLGELKNRTYDDDSTTPKKHIEILSSILGLIENTARIVVHTRWGFVGSNVPRTFENMYINPQTYAGLKCSEVIEQLLVGHRLFLTWIPNEGYCWMVYDYTDGMAFSGDPSVVDPVIYTAVYSSAGVFLAKWEINRVKLVDNSALFHTDAPGFSNWSGWDEMKVTQQLGARGNLIANSELLSDDGWSGSPTLRPMNDGSNAIIQSLIGSSDPDSGVGTSLSNVYGDGSTNIKLSFKYNLIDNSIGPVTINCNQSYTIQANSGGTIYVGVLHFNEATGEKYLTLEPGLIAPKISIKNKSLDGAISPAAITMKDVADTEAMDGYEIVIKGVPASPMTISFGYYAPRIVNVLAFSGGGDSPVVQGFGLLAQPKFEYIDASGDLPVSSTSFLLKNTDRYIENGSDLELLQGTLPAGAASPSMYLGGITKSIIESDLITHWVHDNYPGTFTSYAELAAKIVFSQHGLPAQSVDYGMYADGGLFPPHKLLIDANCDEQSAHMLTAIIYDLDVLKLTGSMVSVLGAYTAVTVVPLSAEKRSSGNNNSSGGGGNHLPLTLAEDCPDAFGVDEDQVFTFDGGKLLVDSQAGTIGVEPELYTNEDKSVIPLYGVRVQENSPMHIGRSNELVRNTNGSLNIHNSATPGGVPLKVDIDNVLNKATVAKTGSYNDLENKPSIPSKFIDLTDTDSAYPANGNVVKGAPDGVPFAENLGDDGAVWVRSQLSETLGANLGFTSSTALEAGKTYQIAVLISGRTVGSVAIKISGATIATVTQTSFIAYTAASTGAHNCEAVASVDFDGTISLITIKEVIAVSRKGLKFVDGAHGTIAELLAFADNLAWGANMPGDFAGSGNIYIGASPESGDESNKVRLAEVLYDRLLKLLTLKGSIELNKDTDNEYKLPDTTPEIATGEESKKFAMTRTGDTAALGWFELLEFISRAAVEAGAVGNVPRIVEVGGVRNVTWGAALAPTAAPTAPSVAIYAADGSITYVGYQHATDPTIKRAKVLSTDAYDALVTAGTVDANVVYLQYEED